jgi:predicted cupin superfamily sugar epimerase
MTSQLTARQLIEALGLAPHPEGGHYREIFRSPSEVTTGSGYPRSASTAIYFLLEHGEFSAFHRVSSDELWHHYGGDGLDLHLLDGAGSRSLVLGRDFMAAERPLGVVPAGCWQAARPRAGAHGYSLAGCTVAPGFEFRDFEMPSRAELLRLFPEHAALIAGLTR